MEQLKILMVDDEARMRKLVKDFLSVKGFLVVEASNGEEALDVFFDQKSWTWPTCFEQNHLFWSLQTKPRTLGRCDSNVPNCCSFGLCHLLNSMG